MVLFNANDMRPAESIRIIIPVHVKDSNEPKKMSKNEWTPKYRRDNGVIKSQKRQQRWTINVVTVEMDVKPIS